MEILGKLGASLSGFWWSLDEDERLKVFMAAAWTLYLVVGVPLALRRRQREREELVAAVAEEVLSRGR